MRIMGGFGGHEVGTNSNFSKCSLTGDATKVAQAEPSLCPKELFLPCLSLLSSDPKALFLIFTSKL